MQRVDSEALQDGARLSVAYVLRLNGWNELVKNSTYIQYNKHRKITYRAGLLRDKMEVWAMAAGRCDWVLLTVVNYRNVVFRGRSTLLLNTLVVSKRRISFDN